MAISLRAVFAGYVADLAKAAASETAFAEEVGIPQPDISRALNAKAGRQITVGQLDKIAQRKKIPLSRMLNDMALVARDMERAEAPSEQLRGRAMSAEPTLSESRARGRTPPAPAAAAADPSDDSSRSPR